MGEEEKIKMIPVLREKGNNAFNKKDYKSAVDNYSMAIGFLEQLMIK